MHRGFKKAFDSAWPDMKQAIMLCQTGNQSLWFTGHSLGAALATMAVATLLEQGKRVNGLYTFGSPRVGNPTFSKTFNAGCASTTFRFVNNNEIVTRLPLAIRYRHVGTVRYIDENGTLQLNFPWWRTLIDMCKGAINDLGELGIDGIKDHDMDCYLACLKKNLGLLPI